MVQHRRPIEFPQSDLGPSLLLRHRGLTGDYVAADSPASFWSLTRMNRGWPPGARCRWLPAHVSYLGI